MSSQVEDFSNFVATLEKLNFKMKNPSSSTFFVWWTFSIAVSIAFEDAQVVASIGFLTIPKIGGAEKTQT